MEGWLPACGRHFGLLELYPELQLEGCRCGGRTAPSANGTAAGRTLCTCFCPEPRCRAGDRFQGSDGDYVCEAATSCYCPGSHGVLEEVRKVTDNRYLRQRMFQ